MACGEVFRMERNTVDHRVAQSFMLGEGGDNGGMA
jgi:sarcosine oxidase subunit delta